MFTSFLFHGEKEEVAVAREALLQPLQSKAAGFQKPLNFFFIPMIQLFHLPFFCALFNISGDRPPNLFAPARRLYTQKSRATTCAQVKTRGRRGISHILHSCSEEFPIRGKSLKEFLRQKGHLIPKQISPISFIYSFRRETPITEEMKEIHAFNLPCYPYQWQSATLSATEFGHKKSRLKGHPSLGENLILKSW